MCVDTRDWQWLEHRPTPAELAAAPGSEALVHELEGFVRALEELPTADGPGCHPTASYVTSRTSLVLMRHDGSTAAIPVGICDNLRLGGREVAVRAVRLTFSESLDRQRDRYAYERTVEAPLTCRTFLGSGPAKAGREQLVTAIRCDPRGDGGATDDATPLTDVAVRTLAQAWEKARLHERGSMEVEDECTELEQRPSRVVARTNRGDVVSFFQSPCGYLVDTSDAPDTTQEIPVLLDDLATAPNS